jgi:hypothetical protein
MTLSSGFVRRFLERHPEVHQVPARALEPERADGANAVSLNAFFDVYEEMQKRFTFHPSLTANFDETMVKFKETSHKVLAPREVTKAHFRMKPHVEHITLGATIFADGSHFKPLLIIGKTYLPAEMVSLVVDKKWCVAGGDTAWITKVVFSQWVLGPFAEDIKRKRAELKQPNAPALLIVDGHSSRADAATMRRLRDEHNIHVLTLVAHSTHVLQPLDVQVFAAFKAQLKLHSRDRRAAFAKAAPERRAALMETVQKAHYHAVESTIVQTGWKKSGLWPVDRSMPLKHEAVNQVLEPELRPNRDLQDGAGDDVVDAVDAPAAVRFDISARVLTSDVAIAEMEAFQKQQKKKEEEMKARKAERAKRQAEKEVEDEDRKRRKLEKEQLREAKAVEKEAKKQEKEKEKEERMKEKEKKEKEKDDAKTVKARKRPFVLDDDEDDSTPTTVPEPPPRADGKRVPRANVLLTQFN